MMNPLFKKYQNEYVKILDESYLISKGVRGCSLLKFQIENKEEVRDFLKEVSKSLHDNII